MASLNMEPAFEPEVLSVREREIVDLAVEGHTDEQIGQLLDISTSTVNSYWVRIRGKLGQLSRTEVVSKFLRHESQLRYADLIAENERLRESEGRVRADLEQSQADLAQSQSDLRVARGGAWFTLALNHAADAMVVCEPPGRIVYANLQAQRMFLAEPGELDGMMAWDLAIPEVRDFKRATAADVFALDGPPRVVMGIESPFYGLRRNGTNFRGVLFAERFVTPECPMAVMTVREFLGETESILKALRQPYKVL